MTITKQKSNGVDWDVFQATNGLRCSAVIGAFDVPVE